MTQPRADADARQVQSQFFQQVDPVELRSYLLGERRLVDGLRFRGVLLLFLDASGQLVSLLGEVIRNRSGLERRPFLDEGVHQSETVLAGKLAARTRAAMRRLIGPREIR